MDWCRGKLLPLKSSAAADSIENRFSIAVAVPSRQRTILRFPEPRTTANRCINKTHPWSIFQSPTHAPSMLLEGIHWCATCVQPHVSWYGRMVQIRTWLKPGASLPQKSMMYILCPPIYAKCINFHLFNYQPGGPDIAGLIGCLGIDCCCCCCMLQPESRRASVYIPFDYTDSLACWTIKEITQTHSDKNYIRVSVQRSLNNQGICANPGSFRVCVCPQVNQSFIPRPLPWKKSGYVHVYPDYTHSL